MVQMTWRATEALLERVRRAAAGTGRSMNEYVTAVLSAATDPDLVGDEAQRVRERLARAGLVAPQGRQPAAHPPTEAVAAARARAGTDTPLSELVERQR